MAHFGRRLWLDLQNTSQHRWKEKVYAWLAFFFMLGGLVLFAVTAAFEAYHHLGRYSLSLTPSDSKWVGINDAGEGIKITARMFRDSTEMESREVAHNAIDIPGRELIAEDDGLSSDRMIVKKDDNIQGYIRYDGLSSNLRRLIGSEINVPYVTAQTEEICTNESGNACLGSGNKIKIEERTAPKIKEEFEDIKLEFKEWIYDTKDPGIVVKIDQIEKGGRGVRLQTDKIVKRSQPFMVEENNIVVALLYIDFEEDNRRRTRFVLLKYR